MTALTATLGAETPSTTARSRMQARRHPKLIACLWLTKLVTAWLLALPLAQVVAHGNVAHHALGDAVLFADGGLFLFEVLRIQGSALLAALNGAAAQGAVLIPLQLLPLTALLVAVRHGRLTLPALAEKTMRALPRVLLVSGAVLLLQGAVWFAFVLVAALFSGATSEDPRATDLAALAVLAAGAFGVLILGMSLDLARASIVQHHDGLLAAARRALGTLARRPLRAIGFWSATLTASLALVAAVAVLVGRIGIATNARFWLVTALHQLTFLLLVLLRAAWLAESVRLTARHREPPRASDALLSPSKPAPDGTVARSASPADPIPDLGA